RRCSGATLPVLFWNCQGGSARMAPKRRPSALASRLVPASIPVSSCAASPHPPALHLGQHLAATLGQDVGGVTLLAILTHQRFALQILEQGIDGGLRHAEGGADVRDLELAALGQQPQHGTNPVRADGKARRSRLPAAGTAILRVSQAGLGEAIDLLAGRVL